MNAMHEVYAGEIRRGEKDDWALWRVWDGNRWVGCVSYLGAVLAKADALGLAELTAGVGQLLITQQKARTKT